MIKRWLRRFSVRQRIFGGFVLLVLPLLLSIGLLVVTQRGLIQEQRDLNEVSSRADRALLRASVRVASSRVNLLRYTQDVVPSPHEALDDVSQARALLDEAKPLIRDPQQQERIDVIGDALEDYRGLIGDIQAARSTAGEPTTRLEFQALRLGYDIGSQIELIVKQSQASVEAATEALQTQATGRLTRFVIGYVVVIALATFAAYVLERSISVPITELREATESLNVGQDQLTIPVEGNDELSMLAETFNSMTAQLTDAYFELERRVEERTEELNQQSAYLRATVGVSQATAAILDVDALLQQSVEIIREQFSLYYVGLFLRGSSDEWVELHAGTGEAGKAMLARGHRIKIGSGMVGWSVAYGEARVAFEVDEDAMRLATPELPETQSEAAIPLRSRDRVLGALTVQDDKPGTFDIEAITILQLMAEQLAVAIDNAQLFTEAQAALDAARRAYGQMTQEAWTELARAQQHLDFACDASGTVRPVSGAWHPEMATAYRANEPVASEDGMLISLPVTARDRVIGVVRLRKPEQAPPWTPRESTMVQSVVEQLGVALESARLYRESQTLAARQQMVGEVTARMRESLDVETVLQTAVREISESLGLADFVVRVGTPEQLLPEASVSEEGSA